ncbi:MAG: flavodoxin/nitric oxide synthase [Promethearchaeota archaeon CR_4]|nr:MAG: flavodoxin/nitric oxide synthase [Candidatus Lokiarchaeota archaeon CR_4]
MKTLIIFFSMGGRTRQVAQTIATELHNDEVQIEELKYGGKKARSLVNEQDAVRRGDLSHFTFNPAILNLAPYDRILFGTPTYGGLPSPVFEGFLENCKNAAGKEWLLFGTCRLSQGRTFNRMREIIEQKGGRIITQQMFKGFFKINPNKVKAFGQSFNK